MLGGDGGLAQATLSCNKGRRLFPSECCLSLHRADYSAKIVNELADPAVFILIGELLESY